jgi:hypothetical protein
MSVQIAARFTAPFFRPLTPMAPGYCDSGSVFSDCQVPLDGGSFVQYEGCDTSKEGEVDADRRACA